MLILHALQFSRLGGPVAAVPRLSVPSVLFETGGHIGSTASARAVSDEPIMATGGKPLAAWVMFDASGLGAVSLGEVKA